jgi:hypothetical protein
MRSVTAPQTLIFNPGFPALEAHFKPASGM